MSRPRESRRRGVIAVAKAAASRRSVRCAFVVLGGGVALVLLTRPVAIGADLLSNVGPASQLQDGALMDAHPLGHYVLDHHFSAVKAGVLSGVDVSGIPPTIAWFLANTLWQLTAFIAQTLITLFTFAFSLDLVNGSGATGGASALEPVSRAVRSIYQRTFGEPWLVVAVLIAGLWAIYNALVRRRYVETAGSLAVSVIYVVIALAFVTAPERTIGTASKWSNAMSGAFLSLTTNGSVTEQGRAKQGAADQLFTLLVYDPWAVLQFGGREHCVRTAGGDKPQSVPVRPLSADPMRDGTLSRRLQRSDGVEADGKVCVNDRNKHALRFLRFSSGSGERDRLYEALKDGDKGKLHDQDPAKRDASYRLGPADKPASASMGRNGQYERLLMAIVVFAGELGIFLLLGALSIAVILAQVLVLLLLAFSPVALVVGVFPGKGHEFFLGWLSRLAGFLVRKAIYSLLLAVLLAVGAAIGEASANLGWLMAFGLQAAFYWATFLFRHQLASPLTLATTGTRTGQDNQALRLATLYAVARTARRALPRRPARPASSDDAPDEPPPEDDDTNDDEDARRPDDGPPEAPRGPRADWPTPPSATAPSAATAAPDAAPEDPRRVAAETTRAAAREQDGAVDRDAGAATSTASKHGSLSPQALTDREVPVGRAEHTPRSAQPHPPADVSERRGPAARARETDRAPGPGMTTPAGPPSSDAPSPGAYDTPTVTPHPEQATPDAANPLKRDLDGDVKRLTPPSDPERTRNDAPKRESDR